METTSTGAGESGAFGGESEESMKPSTTTSGAKENALGEQQLQIRQTKTEGCLAGMKRAWSDNFVSRIAKTCGLRFMFVTLVVYGIDQGAKRALLDLTRVYFYKDRGLTPGQTQRAIAWGDFAWNIKFVYALIMDTIPLYGYHYRPYLFIFGCAGCVSYSLLAAASVVPSVLSDSAAVGCFFLGLNAVVWNDVAIDGTDSGRHPLFAFRFTLMNPITE